jgi:predicted nucleic acid binding AN1-type Zn finger protein
MKDWEKRIKDRVKGLTEDNKLTCDLCGKTLGYVNDCDLEGSYFYCEDCYKENNKTACKSI